MLREIGAPDRVEAWVLGRLARKEKIMGFGHRVYKKGDSRVPIMREFARRLGQRFGQEHWVAICEKLEAVMEREKNLCCNVDLYAAPVFHLLGIPPELNTPIFACSRVRLVRPRHRAARPQPADPSPQPLHRSAATHLSTNERCEEIQGVSRAATDPTRLAACVASPQLSQTPKNTPIVIPDPSCCEK